MPFQSEKQRRFMWMHHPSIARRWAHKYGSQVSKEKKGDGDMPHPKNPTSVAAHTQSETHSFRGVGSKGKGKGKKPQITGDAISRRLQAIREQAARKSSRV